MQRGFPATRVNLFKPLYFGSKSAQIATPCFIVKSATLSVRRPRISFSSVTFELRWVEGGGADLFMSHVVVVALRAASLIKLSCAQSDRPIGVSVQREGGFRKHWVDRPQLELKRRTGAETGMH